MDGRAAIAVDTIVLSDIIANNMNQLACMSTHPIRNQPIFFAISPKESWILSANTSLITTIRNINQSAKFAIFFIAFQIVHR